MASAHARADGKVKNKEKGLIDLALIAALASVTIAGASFLFGDHAYYRLKRHWMRAHGAAIERFVVDSSRQTPSARAPTNVVTFPVSARYSNPASAIVTSAVQDRVDEAVTSITTSLRGSPHAYIFARLDDPVDQLYTMYVNVTFSTAAGPVSCKGGSVTGKLDEKAEKIANLLVSEFAKRPTEPLQCPFG